MAYEDSITSALNVELDQIESLSTQEDQDTITLTVKLKDDHPSWSYCSKNMVEGL